MAGESDDQADCSSVAATHQELTLGLNADVAEWCPSPPHTRVLAAGTYQLNEDTQRREGRLYLYRLEGELRAGSSLSLETLTETTLPGIFDLRWVPGGSAPMLAAALADGSLRVLRPDLETAEPPGASSLQEQATSGPALDGDMALSVDCHAGAGEAAAAGPCQLVSSYSSGALALHQLTPTALTSLRAWKGHDLEAWTASFDAWCPWVVFTGGDDSAWKGWDTRQPDPAALWSDRKSHGAGVCCVASSPHQRHAVCTGSYDERARLWDCRMEARPVAVAAAAGGGGVWRLKWHPTDPGLMLAACMHGGFAVLRADAAAGAIEVVERYPHQQTLAYGAAWCGEVGADGTSVAATCSFYDRLLHVWSPATRGAAPGGP